MTSYLYSEEKIYLYKELIEEIIERNISDELFEKYLDDIEMTLDDNVYIEEYIKDVLREHCEVLTKIESELN